MPDAVSQIETRRRDRGFALTAQRHASVRELVRRGGHWSAAEVHRDLTREAPQASRATACSTPALLHEPGPIGEWWLPGGETLCTECGALNAVADTASDVVWRDDPARFRVVVEGRCIRCGASPATL